MNLITMAPPDSGTELSQKRIVSIGAYLIVQAVGID